ncbi:MAG TPA: ABC transporter permease [Jatrophihabitantaceae bacterium]|jgi:ABC-type transport system involved in multi-copper enzyme maturation permease subunit
MTTLTAAATRVDVDAPIPFARLVRTELRKLTDTRASRWLLAAIVAVSPVVVVVMLLVAKPTNLTYDKFVDFTQTPQKILLPALGILAMTSEWSQRTGLTTFTLVPNRRRVLLAKFSAALALGLAVIAIAFAAGAVGNLLAPLRHGAGSWNLSGGGAGEIVLILVTGLVQGMAFGMAVLVTAPALVLYYVLPNIWSVVFTSTGGLQDVRPWVDINEAESPLYSHDITGAGWLHLLVAVAIWILVPLTIGVARVSRTEVKSS